MEESLTCFRDAGDSLGIAHALARLGSMAAHQGDYRRAQELLTESLVLLATIGHNFLIGNTLEMLARLGAQRWQRSAAERAARLFGAVEALRDSLGVHLNPVTRASDDPAIVILRSKLEEAILAAAWRGGSVGCGS